MFQFAALEQLNEMFVPLSQRPGRSVFFCRLAGSSPAVDAFLRQYYHAALRTGVILDGGIANPTPQNLAYYTEIMGGDFQLSHAFLYARLHKWLPRMSEAQCQTVSSAQLATLQDMQASGKTPDMLRNAYFKFMCWLYYTFERIASRLGQEEPPKILCASDRLSQHALYLLAILSRSGADILLLEPQGDAAYRKLDPDSRYSNLYAGESLGQFPPDFSLKGLQAAIQREARRQRLSGDPPAVLPCTNAWMDKARLSAVLTPAEARGRDPKFYYNCFLCQTGAEDKLTYKSELFSLYKTLTEQNRPVCVAEQRIPIPTPAEIEAIQRGNFQTAEQMAAALSANIRRPQDRELERIMRYHFVELLLDQEGAALSKLTSRAVYLLCWLNRYQDRLFPGRERNSLPVFLLFGGCDSDAEALFLRFLARLPVDVLILIPDLTRTCRLSGGNLLELRQPLSYQLDRFPVEQAQVRVGTAAYEAERELDTLLYQDSGLYRNRQYSRSIVVTLQTTYEEIAILWDQELKYRPHFAADGEVVTLPVFLEKICGVKDGQTGPYWAQVKRLLTPDAILVRELPWIDPLAPNPMKPAAVDFLRNGRLLRDRIKSHPAYPYGILRQETQDYILDKLQLLLDRKTIRGTYVNGTEYTIVSLALNLPKNVLRLIQKFDFTKTNPKLVFLLPGEKLLSLEDSIAVALLNLIGFDIVFFVPTGYQCIEKHFAHPIAEEQQLGDYLYDLKVPDLDKLPAETRPTLLDRLFGRRN